MEPHDVHMKSHNLRLNMQSVGRNRAGIRFRITANSWTTVVTLTSSSANTIQNQKVHWHLVIRDSNHETLISVLGRSVSAQETLPQGPWHHINKWNTGVPTAETATCNSHVRTISQKVGVHWDMMDANTFTGGWLEWLALNGFPVYLHLEELMPPLSK